MEELLKESERSSIYIVSENGNKKIKRVMKKGSCEVYKILRDNPHKFMPKIFEISEDENGITVTEEFIEGKSICEICFNEKDMLKAAKELCIILSHIHGLNIIHRDIKPSNILIDSDGHIRLIDFDAARTAKPEADSDTVCLGTQGFAPPEQYGFSQTDIRSDIYAYGKTLECIFGSLSHRKKYRKIIDKCTRLDPAERYSSAEEILKALNGKNVILPVAASCAAVIAVMLTSIFAMNGLDEDIENISEYEKEMTETTSLVQDTGSTALSETTSAVIQTTATESAMSTPAVETTETVPEETVLQTVTTLLPQTEETSVPTTEQTDKITASTVVSESVLLTAADTETVSQAILKENDYEKYYRYLDLEKAYKLMPEEMEKPLLFQPAPDIPFEYIIIDTASLKENKYAAMVCDYDEDGDDDIFQLSAYFDEDDYFRELCVSVITMHGDVPEYHIISKNSLFVDLISTTVIDKQTGMLNDRQYVQFTVIDIDDDGKKDVILSMGRSGNFIHTQVFYSKNIYFEYSSSSRLNSYIFGSESVFFDTDNGLYNYNKDGNLEPVSTMDLENTYKSYRYVDVYTYMYELEEDPLYDIHRKIAARNR